MPEFVLTGESSDGSVRRSRKLYRQLRELDSDRILSVNIKELEETVGRFFYRVIFKEEPLDRKEAERIIGLNVDSETIQTPA